MKEEFVHEIIDCLPKGRTLFYYFKDRYALLLLSYFIDVCKHIHDVKKSRFGRLLNKPLVKEIIKNVGDGILTKERLGAVWPPYHECYLLTLGKWGNRSEWARYYNQTSRSGTNLVLQLNFSSKHNRQYYRLIKPDKNHPFEYACHPIAGNLHRTLAWARIDLDFDTDEALIEEIQTDWIKMATRGKATAEAIENDRNGRQRVVQRYIESFGYDPKALTKYVNDILKPHIAIWDEAMLAASIWFLKEEIGINKISNFRLSYCMRM